MLIPLHKLHLIFIFSSKIYMINVDWNTAPSIYLYNGKLSNVDKYVKRIEDIRTITIVTFLCCNLQSLVFTV